MLFFSFLIHSLENKMSTPASKNKFLSSTQTAAQSPKTPRSIKLTREPRTPLSVKSSTNKLLNKKEKEKRESTTPSRIKPSVNNTTVSSKLKNAGTPTSSTKTSKKSETLAKRTIIGVLKDNQNFDRTCMLSLIHI